ncbi:transcription-associated protein 1, partial [Teratosphaeriaceae sp. CCFEE 6253]
MESTVRDTFEAGGSHASATAMATVQGPGTPSAGGTPGSPVALTSQSSGVGVDSAPEQTTRQLIKGMHSFKVVAECPIIVVSIFQAHRSLAPKN